ncbi:hypothetical protein HDZ31DRAFT_59489 [Schizophyllum fasciatum]
MSSKRISINDLLCSDPPAEDASRQPKEHIFPEPVILAPHLRKPHNFNPDVVAARPSSSSSTSSTHPYPTLSPEIHTLSRPISSSSMSQHSQRQSPVFMRPPQTTPLSPPISTAHGQAFGLDALVAASEERRRMDTAEYAPHPRGPSRVHHLHLADHSEQAILRYHQQRELASRARSSSSSTSHAQSPGSVSASISPRTMTVPLGPPPYPMTPGGGEPGHAYRAGDPDRQLSPLTVPQKRRHSQSVSSHGSPPLPPPITLGPGRGLDILMHNREHEQERIQREAERRDMEIRRMEEERRRERELAAYSAQLARHRFSHDLAANAYGDKEPSSRHRRDQVFESGSHPQQIQRQILNAPDGPPTIQRMPELHQQGRYSLSPPISRQLGGGPAYGELERERLERQMMERERARELDREKELLLQEQLLRREERELAAREARVRDQERRLRAIEEQRMQEQERAHLPKAELIMPSDPDARRASHEPRAHDQQPDTLSPAAPQISHSPPRALEPHIHRRPAAAPETHHTPSAVQGPSHQTHARHHPRQHPPHPDPPALDGHHHHPHPPHPTAHEHPPRSVQLSAASRPPPGSKAGRAIANARRDSGGSDPADAADMPPRRGVVKHEETAMDVDPVPPALPRVIVQPTSSSSSTDARRAAPPAKPLGAQARMISPPDPARRSLSQGATPPAAPRLIVPGRARSSHTQTSRSASRDTGPPGPGPDDADEWLLEQAAEASESARSPSPPAKKMKWSPPEEEVPARAVKRAASSSAPQRAKSRRARSRTADEEDALLDLERELDGVCGADEEADADSMDVDRELADLVGEDGENVDDELMSLVEGKETHPHKPAHSERAPSTQPSHGKRSHSPAPRPALPRVVSLPSTKEEEDRASMPPPPLKKATSGKKPAESKSRSKKGSSSRAKSSGEGTSQSHKAKAKSGSKSKARKVEDGIRSSEPPAGTPPPAAPAKKSHKKGAGAAAAAAHSRSASAMPAEPEKKADEAKDRRKDEESKEEDDDRLYCICRTTYDETLNMIACDRCDDWYHTMCVELSDQEVELIDQFICPLCIKKHPKLNLRTTYKQRCLNGLRHANPNSPSACHKPARGAFSKYCSDECGVQCMRARIESWERSGGNAGKLWDSLKHADRSEGVVMRVEAVQEKGTEPPLCRTEVIKPAQTKSERDIQQLTTALDDIANVREGLERGLEVLRCRERLLDLALARKRRVKDTCGWDMRLCFGDEDWLNMENDVWDSYEDYEDGHHEDFWCVLGAKCVRHQGWYETRDAELLLDKNNKERALRNLATRERSLRQRLEDLLEAQHGQDSPDAHGSLRSSSARSSGGAARSRSTKKKSSVT